MNRQNLHKSTRLIILLSIFIAFFAFFIFLQARDNPLLVFSTGALLFTFLLFLFNPLLGNLTYEYKKRPKLLSLVFLSALTSLVNLFSFYSLNIDLYQLKTIAIILLAIMGVILIFSLVNMVFSFKEAFLSALLFALFPNIGLIQALSQTMLLVSILLILYSFKYNQKSFLIVTSLTSSTAFISACLLEPTYIIYIPIIGLFYFLNALANKRKPYNSLRFLFFFTGSGFLTTIFLLIDSYFKTSFWSPINLRPLGEIKAYQLFLTFQENIGQIWDFNLSINNPLADYVLVILFAFLLLSFIVGLLNMLKDLHCSFLLFALFPGFYTLVGLFVILPSGLISLPFLIISGAYGLTGAFSHIPISLNKTITNLNQGPDIKVQLNPSYIMPDHWGKGLEDKEEKTIEIKRVKRFFRIKDNNLKDYLYRKYKDIDLKIETSEVDLIIDSLFDNKDKDN